MVSFRVSRETIAPHRRGAENAETRSQFSLRSPRLCGAILYFASMHAL